MLTQEDDVEIHALARRGWSKSAIARHTGRDRKTIAKYLAGRGRLGSRRRAVLSRIARTLRPGSLMTRTCSPACCSRSLSLLGFDRSYPTLVREIRELGLRPVCECCKAGRREGHGRAGARAG